VGGVIHGRESRVERLTEEVFPAGTVSQKEVGLPPEYLVRDYSGTSSQGKKTRLDLS